MDGPDSKRTVKIIGSNGQISLGKQFAGRQVLVEEREPGVWLIRTASVVPDSELGCISQIPARTCSELWFGRNTISRTIPTLTRCLRSSSMAENKKQRAV